MTGPEADRLPPAEPTLAAGATVGPYRIEACVGRGGMGEVYRAVHHDLQRRVALKIMGAGGHRWGERFREEARRAAALEHPHIVAVYDAGLYRHDVLFIAMRYVDGPDLAAVLGRRGVLEPAELVRVIPQVASALDYIHEMGLVHRDIKPSNVLVRTTPLGDHAYVSDFGIVRAIQDSRPGAAAEGFAGTVQYTAPEVLTGAAASAASDLYSFGCLVFEVLTGVTPFPRATPVACALAQVNEPPPTVSALCRTPRSELDGVIARALAKDPRRRYRSCGEFAGDLVEVLGDAVPEVSQRPRSAHGSTVEDIPLPVVSAASLWGAPIPHGPLVGRDPDLARLAELMRAPSRARLVTITGLGGVGKTRVAIEFARQAQSHLGHRSHVVGLSSVRQPDQLALTVCEALRIQIHGEAPLESLIAHLAGRETLLVLDNFEHLLSSRDVIATLLHACRHLTIVVTSRVALGVAGEQQYRLRPLTPPGDRAVDAKSLMINPAAELFTFYARAADPDFRLTEDNVPAVVDICRRLDGMPLALELTAARVALLGVEEVASRLGDSFNLALDARSGADALRAALDWSWELLTKRQQAVLSALTTFVDGFTVQAAEAVCRASLEDLEALHDASLISSRPTPRGRRLHLLFLVGAYAADRLAPGGEAPLRQRHLKYFRQTAEQLSRADFAHQEAHRSELENDRGNYFAALEHAIEQRDGASAVALGGALGWYEVWQADALRRYESLLTAALALNSPPGGDRARALCWCGVCAQVLGNPGRSAELLEEALREAQSDAGHGGRVHIASSLGLAYNAQRRWQDGRRSAEQAVMFGRRSGDTYNLSLALVFAGGAHSDSGDPAGGRPLVEEGLRLAREIGASRPIAMALGSLGEIALLQEEFAVAADHLDEGMPIARNAESYWLLAAFGLRRAAGALLAGDATTAAEMLAESLQICLEHDLRMEFRDSLVVVSALAWSLGLPDPAGDCPGWRSLLLNGITTQPFLRKVWERLGVPLPATSDGPVQTAVGGRARQYMAQALSFVEGLAVPIGDSTPRRVGEPSLTDISRFAY